jgi:hypothetical protein
MISQIKILIVINAVGMVISSVSIAQDIDLGNDPRPERGDGIVAQDSLHTTALIVPENAEGLVPPEKQAENPSTQPENTVKACIDNKDNDGDQLVDCADPDCSYIIFCAGFSTSPFWPQPIELTIEKQPHIRRAIFAANALNFASYWAPLSALAVSDFSDVAGLGLLSSGPSSNFLSAVLSSSAMSIWHHKVVSSGYRVSSDFKVGSWMLTSVVIGANIAWWVMAGLAINGESSAGLSMGMIGIAIGTPIIHTIKLLGVDRRWEKRLQRTVTGVSPSR